MDESRVHGNVERSATFDFGCVFVSDVAPSRLTVGPESFGSRWPLGSSPQFTRATAGLNGGCDESEEEADDGGDAIASFDAHTRAGDWPDKDDIDDIGDVVSSVIVGEWTCGTRTSDADCGNGQRTFEWFSSSSMQCIAARGWLGVHSEPVRIMLSSSSDGPKPKASLGANGDSGLTGDFAHLARRSGEATGVASEDPASKLGTGRPYSG
jgi:hypothetical protein